MQGIYARVQKKLNFSRNFGWQPKFVKGFRFLLDRNRKGKNWFRFPLKGKGILAERKISAENFSFLCSLVVVEGVSRSTPWRSLIINKILRIIMPTTDITALALCQLYSTAEPVSGQLACIILIVAHWAFSDNFSVDKDNCFSRASACLKSSVLSVVIIVGTCRAYYVITWEENRASEITWWQSLHL